MRKVLGGVVIVFSLLLNSMLIKANEEWKISKVTIDYVEAPINVMNRHPNITWVIVSKLNDQRQTHYRVQISTKKELLTKNSPDVWSSGKIKSAQSTNIYPEGNILKSNTDYWVKVTSWNQDGRESTFNTQFSTAYFEPKVWQAMWIGYRSEAPYNAETATSEEKTAFKPDSIIANRSQYLRKEIDLKKNVRRARVFVTGLGFYELNINGEKIGDHVLAPAKTRYTDRVLYEVFDVREKLVSGKNALGIHLGNGWYNPAKKYQDWRMPFWGYPRALMQLELEYEDGTNETIKTDMSWRAALGPIIANDIYDGESYDARLELRGWDLPGYTDASWKNVVPMSKPAENLMVQVMSPERVMQTFDPLNVYKINATQNVYDLGQNITGWAKIKVKGEAGAKVTIRYAEDLKADQTLDVKSNRAAKNTDIYILNGSTEEIYEPRFTYHGFQYIEVTVAVNVQVLDIQGQFVYTSVANSGTLITDNPLINKIHDATVLSQKGAFQGLPVDCPQRDERLGWMTDGYVTADEAMLNFNTANFYAKWLDDVKFAQNEEGALPHIAPTFSVSENTNWSCGSFPVIWDHYSNHGDKQVLKNYYPMMKSYVEYLEKNANNYILKADKYGDWGNPAQDDKGKSGWVRGFPKLSTTAMFYFCADILSKSAEALRKIEDVKKYNALKLKIRAAFNGTYFDESTLTYKGEDYHFQYSQGIPLFLGLTPDVHRDDALANLVNDILKKREGHIYAGIQGLKYIYEMLMATDRNDVVYQFVNAKGYPGFDEMLKGRNTFPEWWNGSGSHNHVMFGSIDAWFYRSLAGIRTNVDAPGYEEIIIKPFFPSIGLNEVSAKIETIKGEVTSSWARDGSEVTLKISIPANSSASVVLPFYKEIKINGVKMSNNSQKALNINSGNYTINLKI
ncbi:hypothetical protein EZ428_18480 [Pedobacter frigiditerrae]|uniref:alpha-L-rhamnosidase n=1 Tax=Pedobacter frigiditerrae TaxID=2530452 RepID=A0A4V2MI17_9SPHI|nr:family 78 glycoside hydrolase catalytic domain [Pedobacter frigiditerrae]TCC88626.1 hypothetical protein EZ428_18480 [Pedobacter frigiditerrae]